MRAKYITIAASEKHREEDKRGRNAGRLGASSELFVAADLMRMGYDIFRALNGSAVADLLVCLVGEYIPVEVKTLQHTHTQQLRHRLARRILTNRPIEIVAMVNPANNEVFYSPPLKRWVELFLGSELTFDDKQRQELRLQQGAESWHDLIIGIDPRDMSEEERRNYRTHLLRALPDIENRAAYITASLDDIRNTLRGLEMLEAT